MNTFCHRASFTGGLLVVSLFGSVSVNAIEPSATAAEIPSCHMETRRFAVWPHGPKQRGVLQTPRYVAHMRLVCDDEKTASKPVRDRQRTSPR